MNPGSKVIFDSHFVPEQIQLAVMDGQVVAYIHIDSQNGTPHVRMMCVLPEYQRKGIGSSLLKSFIHSTSAAQQDAALGVFSNQYRRAAVL